MSSKVANLSQAHLKKEVTTTPVTKTCRRGVGAKRLSPRGTHWPCRISSRTNAAKRTCEDQRRSVRNPTPTPPPHDAPLAISTSCHIQASACVWPAQLCASQGCRSPPVAGILGPWRQSPRQGRPRLHGGRGWDRAGGLQEARGDISWGTRAWHLAWRGLTSAPAEVSCSSHTRT